MSLYYAWPRARALFWKTSMFIKRASCLKDKNIIRIMLYPKQWQYLKRTHELQKMPHALLFYGQHSIGKKALAVELVKLLNCECQDQAQRPCLACRTCLDIEKNVHPDLLIVEPEEDKEIKISQIRALQSHLSLRAYAAPFKAVIIDR